ncbi:MAG: hypothetical protein C0404_13305 [Verrucomicrobia bacterium]|nr:hypothetical protein [Verrucomicrobiota bacterium]
MKSLAMIISMWALTAAAADVSPGALEFGKPFRPLTAGGELRRDPDVAFGADSWLVVWQDGWSGLGGDSKILGARIAPDGKILDAAPIVVSAGKAIRERPRVAFGNKTFLVVWQEFNGEDYDIRAVRVSSEGKPLDAEAIAVVSGVHNQSRPAVASDGDGFLVVWQDFRGGKNYEIFGARVSADGKLPDGAMPVAMGSAGHTPSVAFSGGEYLVTIPGTTMVGLRVSREGKPLGAVKASGPGGREGGPPAVAGAADGFLVVASRSPEPDPWGWCGPPGILVYTFKGSFAPAAPGGYAHEIAMRQVPQVLDSAFWKDVVGWPAGMRGGFKGTHNGLWPSYHTAVCHDGRHGVAVWMCKRLERSERPEDYTDLYAARFDASGGDVVNFDPLPVPAALGPESQFAPRLAAGPQGAALLVYESKAPTGGSSVECCLVSDTADTRPPAIQRVSVDGPTSMRVFFDEPLDPVSAADAKAYRIEGVEVKSAALGRHRFAEPRVVTLTTVAQKIGDARKLVVSGVKDRAGNATKDAACDYVYAPGRPLEPGPILEWLILGHFPADWKINYIDPTTVRPNTGDKVEFDSGEKKLSRAWRRGGTSQGFLRLSGLFGGDGGTDKSTGYAHLYLWSPRAQKVTIRIDSNDGERTWVNGKEVGFVDATRGLAEVVDRLPAELKSGWNQLLVECDNKTGVWLLALRILDETGREIEGLNWQLDDPAKAPAP